MTQDEIIRMAREAGAGFFGGPFALLGEQAIESFAALVAAHEREKLLKDMLKDNPFLAEQLQTYINLAVAAEREACAKVCEAECIGFANDDEQLNRIAAAIRARSEK